MRLPVFDCEVVAEKANSYTKMGQNELAFQLLNAGVFNLQMADQSLLLLDNMDFKGKDKLVQKLHEGQTMQQELAMWQQMALQLAQQYEPQTAQQMAMALQAEGGPVAMGQPGEVDPEAIRNESDEKGFMTRAREEARASAEPF